MQCWPMRCTGRPGAHDEPVFPNLLPDMRLDDTNQLWVADLTYLRLEREFV